MMDREVLDRIREGWRLELRAAGAFRRPGRHVEVRRETDAPRAWVGVARLAGATCVSLPPGAAGRRRHLDALDLDADLTDPAVFARAVGPVGRSIGPATLAFLDPATATAGDQPRVGSVPAGHDAVRRLAAACGPDAEESGLLAVDSPVAVWRVGDLVVAASGYQVWHGRLAHLSVLVHPAHRGQGLGSAVAAGAVAGSVAAGLVPQWRARTTLVASRRIARSLGFVELGRQTTYELPTPPPGPATGGR
jgi:GNAT superfamily N-acetyltransferase